MKQLAWLDRQVGERICEVNGCSNVLSKRQKRFCSNACRRDRVLITCKNCGVQKEVWRSYGKQKCCSIECYRVFHEAHEKISITCKHCGRQRKMKKSKGNRKFCSRSCLGKSRRVLEWPDKHGVAWHYTGDGYIYALWHKHPLANKNGNVLQHRHVAWEAHGFDSKVLEQLKNGATVHHKNGKGDDNRIENLEIRVNGKHPIGISLDDMRETLRAFGDTVIPSEVDLI